MKRFRIVVLAAVVIGVVYSVVSFAVTIGVEETTGQTVVVFGPSDIIPNPDPCICPMNVDPVVCGTFPNKKVYSNACVAACEGATGCAGIAIQF